MSTQRRVRITDVAARAGVAAATVSRVLAGKPGVNPEMQRRVLDAAAELGYQPDVLAQGLRRGTSRSVGFIADDLSHNAIADIATGAEGVLRSDGYSLLVMNSERDPRLDVMNIAVLRARRVDALMIAPVTEESDDLLAALSAIDVPVVVIESELPSLAQASLVASDHRAGVRDALLHLVGVGHERITLLTGPLSLRSARERQLAIADAAATSPPPVRFTTAVSPLDDEGARRVTADLLEAADAPTALVVGDSQLLVGALRSVREAGLAIGLDLSLVTSDPSPLSSVFDPPLAGISRDSLGLGVAAARLLLDRLRDPHLAPEAVILTTEFGTDASVGPPRPGRM